MLRLRGEYLHTRWWGTVRLRLFLPLPPRGGGSETGRLLEPWSGKLQAKAPALGDSRRVMVVDDHVAAGDMLLEIPSMEGYAVRVAPRGETRL